MTTWLQQLQNELNERRSQHRLRSLHGVDRCARLVRRDGRDLLHLCGNDYLALASHPKLIEAVCEAARRWGVGAGASRLVSGHLEIHAEVERRFARFKHAEAALLTSSGYVANLSALTALAEPPDVILIDKLSHASLIDAARASGATMRAYPHGNLARLQQLLERAADARRRFIVTDSVFSMDGDVADLPALCDLRDAFEAILVVDEAHATGVLGENGAGLAEAQGVAGRIDVTVSTASKALGGLGGIVTAAEPVIQTLVNRARPFIYSTAVPPAQAAALNAALDVIEQEPERRRRLTSLNQRLRKGLRAVGWAVADDPAPIVPLVVGEDQAAVALAGRLEEAGFWAPAIRPPTVAPGAARVRVTLRADLEDGDVDRLIAAVGVPPLE